MHWLVQEAIDSPVIWLSDEAYADVRRRFSQGSRRPSGWPQPHLVSVCTSPEFVENTLRKRLLTVVKRFTA